MSEKNLVKDYLLEQKIINSDNFLYGFYYDEMNWDVYKEKDDTILYVSYELTEYGIGYAFCVRIICKKLTYDMGFTFYSKSFTNSTTKEWDGASDSLKDKLLCNTMEVLKTYE